MTPSPTRCTFPDGVRNSQRFDSCGGLVVETIWFSQGREVRCNKAIKIDTRPHASDGTDQSCWEMNAKREGSSTATGRRDGHTCVRDTTAPSNDIQAVQVWRSSKPHDV